MLLAVFIVFTTITILSIAFGSAENEEVIRRQLKFEIVIPMADAEPEEAINPQDWLDQSSEELNQVSHMVDEIWNKDILPKEAYALNKEPKFDDKNIV